MFACSVTVRCPSDEAGSYYHLYFQKNKQWRARRTISIPCFNQVPLPMSVCVLVEMLGGERRRGMRTGSGWRKEGGRGHSVGVMRFGGLKVGYSIGLSCRWHPFGRINQHTCSGSDWISYPLDECRHPQVQGKNEGWRAREVWWGSEETTR